MSSQPHSFHIPVMGTGFTIDTPLKVARYGISSVVSLVDDVLIEQVRRFHCQRLGRPYAAIAASEEDSRARRITAYLDLLDDVVAEQVRTLRASPFEPGSEITRYYELLPESDLKQAYRGMLAANDPDDKARRQEELRARALPGSIDVNIMTKLDRDAYQGGQKQAPEFADAMSALRGYAKSTLRSALVFSAGINRRLYTYAAKFDDFMQDEGAQIKKQITLKVSEFRSALIQGKFLAKQGLWVSEYRIESGVNCGGHAFTTLGHLLGPVLEEFRQKKQELVQTVMEVYQKALRELGRPAAPEPPQVRVTAQGGIGTAQEHEFLLRHYHLDSAGWGSPFLLVPEATNVDQAHLQKLTQAQEGDIYLSQSSPLGVPFWSLNTSASEEAKRRRIHQGTPGSPCPKRFVALNTEFGPEPICPASREYIRRKLEGLHQQGLQGQELDQAREALLAKACLCHDLAGGATLNYGIDSQATPSVCCGPNMIWFKRIASLEEMVGHIYGRFNLIADGSRPHMFLQELRLYVDQLSQDIQKLSDDMATRPQGHLATFRENLLEGIGYYRDLARQFIAEQRGRFLVELKALQNQVEALSLPQDEGQAEPARLKVGVGG
ncbi:MAG: hypothetical protein HY910_11055 [Desulfarculus sp.]|nr:hypothetical protein [Desulfarculus sp.]